jgi:hypothetical protein
MTPPLRALALVTVLLVAVLPATAFAGRRDAASTAAGAGGTTAGASAAGGTTHWVFTPRERQFLPHTSNQGWWSNTHNATNDNDNYTVGRCCGGGEFRNFFTFHLTGLTGTVVSATLVLKRYDARGGHEAYRLSSVATAAKKLNHNVGISPAIFKDLGRGTVYGTYRLSTTDSGASTYQLPLNDNARAAIHKAAGGFFSVGGKLTSLQNGGALFLSSGGRGPQELIVTTSP